MCDILALNVVKSIILGFHVEIERERERGREREKRAAR
jgi:hypothetical protein